MGLKTAIWPCAKHAAQAKPCTASSSTKTAMSVGMVSGIIMAEAASAGCGVAEYSPNEVKESVAGWGGADKDEVGKMVQTLLDLPKRLAPADAADAVAVALCHLARVPARSVRISAGGTR